MDAFCRRGRKAKAVSVKSVRGRHSLPGVNVVGRWEAGLGAGSAVASGRGEEVSGGVVEGVCTCSYLIND